MALLSLTQRAYDHILDQLLARSLRAGDWLDRRAVASELQISLAPVSEAVAQLEVDARWPKKPRATPVKRRGWKAKVCEGWRRLAIEPRGGAS